MPPEFECPFCGFKDYVLYPSKCKKCGRNIERTVTLDFNEDVKQR